MRVVWGGSGVSACISLFLWSQIGQVLPGQSMIFVLYRPGRLFLVGMSAGVDVVPRGNCLHGLSVCTEVR